jgi:hypothetical protein
MVESIVVGELKWAFENSFTSITLEEHSYNNEYDLKLRAALQECLLYFMPHTEAVAYIKEIEDKNNG